MAETLFTPQSLDTDLATTVRQPQSELRKAIAEVAGTSATAPATTAVVGGVKKTPAIAAIPTPASATAEVTATKVNELITAFKAAGIVT